MKIGYVPKPVQNLSINNSVCNGTRLQIIKLHKHFIAVKINHPGKVSFLPRINLDKEESIASRIPFIMHRIQFPVVLPFPYSINKSQAQSIDRVGIYTSIDNSLAMVRCSPNEMLIKKW